MWDGVEAPQRWVWKMVLGNLLDSSSRRPRLCSHLLSTPWGYTVMEAKHLSMRWSHLVTSDSLLVHYRGQFQKWNFLVKKFINKREVIKICPKNCGITILRVSFFFSLSFCYLLEFSCSIFSNKEKMSWLFSFQYVNLRAHVALLGEVEWSQA